MKKITIVLFLLSLSLCIKAQINYDTLYLTKKVNYDTSYLAKKVNYDTLHLAKKGKVFGISPHYGYNKMIADIPGNGYGYGVRLIAPMNATLSLRLNYFGTSSSGISLQPWTHSSVGTPFGGGLVEYIYQPYQNNPDGWFPSYSFSQFTIELEGLLSITKLLNKQFDMPVYNFDLYILGSYGFYRHTTRMDVLDQNGKPYINLISKTGWTNEKFDTKEGREAIKKAITDIYDGEYETQLSVAIKKITYSYGAGLKFNINSRLNLGIEYKIIKYSNFDYADGIRFKSSVEFSGDDDSARYADFLLEYKF